MKNIFIILLLIPYLFLASSVEEGKDLSPKEGMKCVVSRSERYNSYFGLNKVHYSGFNMLKNQYIILPRFKIDENVIYAKCENRELLIGATDWIKVGDRIRVYSRNNIIKLFGFKLFEEENIFMFGKE